MKRIICGAMWVGLSAMAVACGSSDSEPSGPADATATPGEDISVPITDTAAHPPDSGAGPDCTPNKTCADYPGQCGTALSDGCVGTVDCSNVCSGGLICLQEQCVTPPDCTPSCGGKECGGDGCGGSCGTCDAGETCSDGACVVDCVPACDDATCGEDGCGGSCGGCADGESCVAGTCVEEECKPSCGDSACGDDGCGGSCGDCAAAESCIAGQCEADCVPACGDALCGDDGCGGSCGDCVETETCEGGQCVAPCAPSCDGLACGSDGCGGSCGTCAPGQKCLAGACTVCVPDCDGKTCGADGCGNLCGSCAVGESCEDFVCVGGCEADCSGKTCGTDGCGGSCGSCEAGLKCVTGACEPCSPDCEGKTCGANGCGGLCGTCSGPDLCVAFSCVAAPPLQVRINEVLADPATAAADKTVGDANCDGKRDASQDEFVEIVNTGSGDFDLGEATLSDEKKVRHTFPKGTVLKPGEAIVVFGGGEPAFDGSSANGQPWCVTLPGAVQVVTASSGLLGLSNGGDTLTLASADGTVLDTLGFGDELDGSQDQSLVRSPELSGTAFILHTAAPASIGAQSPGTRANGAAL